jgi:hypothetical protein
MNDGTKRWAMILEKAGLFAQEIGAARDTYNGEYDIEFLECAGSVEARIYDVLRYIRSADEWCNEPARKLVAAAAAAFDELRETFGQGDHTPLERVKWVAVRAGKLE